jgi:hypothetical protein
MAKRKSHAAGKRQKARLRKRPSVRDQIERTLPDRLENAWYKKPRGKILEAALARSPLGVRPRKPRKGETVFIHTHAKGGLTPTARDILSFMNQMRHGIRTTVIACTDGNQLQGYTVVSTGKNTQLEKAYSYMSRLNAEGRPKTMEEARRRNRRVKAALTRYGFLVKVVPMPPFFAQTSWKTSQGRKQPKKK